MGLQADLTNFLIKEARANLTDAITFLDLTLDQISQYKEGDPKEKDDNRDSDKDADPLPPDKEGEQN